MAARVLIIDDNQMNRKLFTCLLEAGGYETIEAVDGEAGLRAASEERPDLILCDLIMPGVDGREVLRRLKQNAQLRSIPVVALTALAMNGDRETVLAAGFDGYISKPIKVRAFIAQVGELLPSTSSLNTQV
jgi:CheY-like chemotaxis protein